MEALPADVVEAAALGDLDTIKKWTGHVDARAKHPQLPAGCTLLMAAASAGNLEILSWLLEHGADPNLYASGGINALLFATTGRHSSAVSLLLGASASLEAVSLQKKDHVRVNGRRTAMSSHTATDLARANGDTVTLAILEEHSARLERERAEAAAALLAEEESAEGISALPPPSSAASARSSRKRDKKRRGKHPPPQLQQVSALAASTPATAVAVGDEDGVSGETDGEVETEVDEAKEVDEELAAEEMALALCGGDHRRSSALYAAAADAARRRGALLSHTSQPPAPPPPPPCSPCSARRRRKVPGLLSGGSSSPSPGASPASSMHDRLDMMAELGAASSASCLQPPAAATELRVTQGGALARGRALEQATDAHTPRAASHAATSSTAAGPSSVAAAAAAELEEMQAMEARAEAKAQHMRELDERFEMLQLARATSHTSLSKLDSSTSLASLASAATDDNLADELTCVICMENPTDATLVHGSSAHVCCCLSCANNLKSLEQSCPMCRKPIEAVLRLYFA